jgi:hypothetical protein
MFTITKSPGLNQGQILCGSAQRLYIHRQTPVDDQMIVPYNDLYTDSLAEAMRQVLGVVGGVPDPEKRIRALADAYSRDNLFVVSPNHPRVDGAVLSEMVPFTLIETYQPKHALAAVVPLGRVVSIGWVPAGPLTQDTPLHVTRRLMDSGMAGSHAFDVLDGSVPLGEVYLGTPGRLHEAGGRPDGTDCWVADPLAGMDTTLRHEVPCALMAPNQRLAWVLKACYATVETASTATSMLGLPFGAVENPTASLLADQLSDRKQFLSHVAPPPATLGEAHDRKIRISEAGVREITATTNPTPLGPMSAASLVASYLTGLLPGLAAAGGLGALAVSMRPGQNAECSGTTLRAVGVANALAEFRLAEHLTRIAETMGELHIDAFLTLSGTTRVTVRRADDSRAACVVCPTALTPYRSPLLMDVPTVAAATEGLCQFLYAVLEG